MAMSVSQCKLGKIPIVNWQKIPSVRRLLISHCTLVKEILVSASVHWENYTVYTG